MCDSFSFSSQPPRPQGNYGYHPRPPPSGYGSGYPLPASGPPPPASYHGYNNNNNNNNNAYNNTYDLSNNYPPPPIHNRGPSPNPIPFPNTTSTTAPAPNQPPPAGPRTYHLRQSPQTHKIIHVHPAGTPPSTPPLYSITSSPKSSKADYVLAHGPDPDNANALTAEIKAHTFSSKYDLTVRGTTCLLKESTMGDKYRIDIPGMGAYRWYTDQEKLSGKMWLKDEAGRVLAVYDKSKVQTRKSSWKKFVGGKERDLEVVVPCSEFFVEVLLVSIYAVKMAKEGALEAAGEIVGALAGA
ncbi:hypothetical protein BDW59DRAFT_164358 [Aspergillus cavernicola]|uniref:Uncharacterized protein n=1 Tax=Aspergillus cavernicola TaxID=176166 RepID=A0ABR4HZM8_9EURO